MKKRLVSLLAVLVLLAAFVLPSLAVETEQFIYVEDGTNYITDSQFTELNDLAEDISSRYGCGVYIVVLADMSEYGYYNIETCAEAAYDEFGLGWDDARSGVLLMLDMATRAYDIDACGYGNTAFTDYGKEQLSYEFTDNFRNDDWYGGMKDFINQCGYYLQCSRSGNPIDVAGYRAANVPSQGERIKNAVALSFVISVIIALITCLIFKGQMKSVAKASTAANYIKGDIALTAQSDVFTHTTETRTRIESDSSRSGGGGGTSVSSSGHSHSSGHF